MTWHEGRSVIWQDSGNFRGLRGGQLKFLTCRCATLVIGSWEFILTVLLVTAKQNTYFFVY